MRFAMLRQLFVFLILFPSLFTCLKQKSVCTELTFDAEPPVEYDPHTGNPIRVLHRTWKSRKISVCCAGYFGEPPNCKLLCNLNLLNNPLANGKVKLFTEDGKLLNPKNVKTVLGGYTVRYECNNRYTLEGNEARICQHNGEGWTDSSQPTCQLTHCSHPDPPANGHLIVPGRFEKGYVLKYACDKGHKLKAGDTQRVCQLVRGGLLQWSGSPPVCSGNYCGDPGIPNSTKFGVGLYGFKPTFIRCDEGFVMTGGSGFRRCEENLEFSGGQLICKPFSDQCEGRGSIVLDPQKCDLRCECDDKNQSVNCVRVRKSWTDLSSDEKQRYINAVKTITTDEQYKARYEKLAKDYTTSIIETKKATKTSPNDRQREVLISKKDRCCSKLIINRYFLLQYENLLREVDCNITIPYWDWTAFRTTPYKHPVWNNTLGFGNSSLSIDECVSKGPFNFEEFTVPDDGIIESVKTDKWPNCLKRSYKKNRFPYWEYVTDKYLEPLEYIYRTLSFDSDMSLQLVVPYLFLTYLDDDAKTVESLVGGHFDSDKAVYDPLYPLHLSFVDFLFDIWKRLPSKYGKRQFLIKHHYFGEEDISTKISLDKNEKLPGGVSISYNVPDIEI